MFLKILKKKGARQSFNKFVEQIIIFLNSLEDKKTYKITPLIKEVNTEGQVTVKTISAVRRTGIIVSKNINSLNLCEKLKFDINSCVQKYQLDFVSCEFGLIFKQWLTADEFFGSFAKVEKVIDNMLTDSIKAIKTDDDKVLKDIKKRISINFLPDGGKFSDIIMDEYGERVNENTVNIEDTDILLFKKLINGIEHLFSIRRFEDIDNNGNKVIKNEVSVKLDENDDSEFVQWTDVKLLSDYNKDVKDFIRYRDNHAFIYRDDKLKYSEIFYNFPNFVELHKDEIFDDKIGSLDLETHPINLKIVNDIKTQKVSRRRLNRFSRRETK